MAISIEISDTVRFKVEGTTNDDKGVAHRFDFWLLCERLPDTCAVQAYLEAMAASESNTPVTDALLAKCRGWSGVKAADGSEVPFSDDTFRRLMNRPGLAFIAHTAYLRESGAKEKN